MLNSHLACIEPFELDDPVLDAHVAVRVSELYSTIHVGERVYYFQRETGQFDGTSRPMGDGRVMEPLAVTQEPLASPLAPDNDASRHSGVYWTNGVWEIHEPEAEAPGDAGR